MPSRTHKHIAKQNKTVKTFTNLKDKPKAPKHGVFISIERVSVNTEYPELKGDLVKRYQNGKLMEQTFYSETKMREFIENMQNHPSIKMRGGAKVVQPQVIVVQSGTTAQQRAPMGFWGTVGASFAGNALANAFFRPDYVVVDNDYGPGFESVNYVSL
jgi:hypothetical protein